MKSKIFDPIIGNDDIKRYLNRMVESGAIGNSLLFAGPEGIGKSLFAQAFAKLVVGNTERQNHPDIRHYRPEGKIGMHSIESMRQFTEEVYLSPFESKRKVFIIHDAHRMLTYSANALLKTFEEPAEDAVIILLSSAPNKLLPTIRSRCRIVHFQRIPEEYLRTYIQNQWELDGAKIESIVSQADGSIGKAHRIIDEHDHEIRDLTLGLIAQGQIPYHTLNERIGELCDQIETSQTEVIESAREELTEGFNADLTAGQKEAIEKEINGIAATHLADEISGIFDTILGWHRDLHLIAVNGNPDYLVHRDYREQLEQSKGVELHSLEQIQKILDEAKLSLERSTSLPIILENLFLKLS